MGNRLVAYLSSLRLLVSRWLVVRVDQSVLYRSAFRFALVWHRVIAAVSATSAEHSIMQVVFLAGWASPEVAVVAHIILASNGSSSGHWACSGFGIAVNTSDASCFNSPSKHCAHRCVSESCGRDVNRNPVRENSTPSIPCLLGVPHRLQATSSLLFGVVCCDYDSEYISSSMHLSAHCRLQ